MMVRRIECVKALITMCRKVSKLDFSSLKNKDDANLSAHRSFFLITHQPLKRLYSLLSFSLSL